MSYTILDNRIFDDENITTHELAVYVVISRYFNRNKGYAYPSYEQILKASKIGNRNTLIKALNGLEEKGYIKRQLSGRKNLYMLLNDKTGSEVYQVQNCTSIESEPIIGTEVNLLQVQKCTSISTNKTTIINTNIEQQVAHLWSLYPNKKGKAQAVKKIPKLIQKYGYEKMIECVQAYTDECKGKDIRYVQHGSTFFNSGYLDYMESVKSEPQYYYEEDPVTGEQIRKRVV